MNRYQTWQQKARGMTTMMALLIGAMLLAACALQPIAATQPVSAEQQNKQTDTTTTPEQGDQQMTASLLVRHEVNDFAAWKKEYDGSAELMKGLGVIAESVYRDLDNPNMVTVYHQFADMATVEAFTVALKGDDFKAMAKRQGIQLETMKVFLMEDVLPRSGISTESGTASLIVRHEVKDFDTWKKTYDGGAEFIKGLGVIADSVHRDLDNPNMVTVYHQFTDAGTAKAFIALVNSDEFRRQGDPVKKGGVILETVEIFLMEDVQ